MSGGVSATTRLDRTAVLAGSDGVVRVELVLGAEDRPGDVRRVPTDLVVVLDRSGSMDGAKIVDARRAVLDLADALRDDDRFALVSYANDARVDRALDTLAGGGHESLSVLVRRIASGGGTNMSAGLDVALGLARPTGGRSTRVVLLSDGLANQGDASVEGLCARGRRLSHDEGILSTVGIGFDFNEVLMTQLADAGTGNFYFLEQAGALDAVLRGELRSARTTVASGLAVTLSPTPGVEVLDVAGLPLERGVGAVTFRPGALFAGQERRLWITYRVPTSGDGASLGQVDVAWTDADRPRRLALAPLPRVDVVHGEAQAIAALDEDAYAEGIVGDAFQAMRQRVAAAVAAGRADDAEAEIDAFVASTAPLAEAAGNERALAAVGEAKALRDQAVQAAAAPSAAPARKEYAKREWSEAQDERRAGAKPDAGADAGSGR
jgi:Ca-activated chloride channel family protein